LLCSLLKGISIYKVGGGKTMMINYDEFEGCEQPDAYYCEGCEQPDAYCQCQYMDFSELRSKISIYTAEIKYIRNLRYNVREAEGRVNTEIALFMKVCNLKKELACKISEQEASFVKHDSLMKEEEELDRLSDLQRDLECDKKYESYDDVDEPCTVGMRNSGNCGCCGSMNSPYERNARRRGLGLYDNNRNS
jgi:hypothetical protein